MSEQSDTNMTVITDKNLYEFNLVSHPALLDTTYKIKFTYGERVKNNKPLSRNPVKVNTDYSYAGNERLKPDEVFDDGEFFTYIKLPDSSNMPAFYAVDGNREESIVNYRLEGEYVVLEEDNRAVHTSERKYRHNYR